MNTQSAWIKRALLIAPEHEPDGVTTSTRKRYVTSASYKFENSKLGNSFEINPIPQFTRWADPKVPPMGQPEHKWADGTGRYHSEAYHDQRQLVHMTFGVPSFNSLVGFFSTFFDYRAAALANTGRINAAAYLSGNVTGFILSLPLQPFIYASTWASKFFNFLSGTGGSKWYYFKPTMHNFWSAVNNIANLFAVNLGLMPRVLGDIRPSLKDTTDVPVADIAKAYHAFLPELFREEGGIDVMAYSVAAQSRAYKFQRYITEARERASTNAEVQSANDDAAMQTYSVDKSLTAETLFNEAGRSEHFIDTTDNGKDYDDNIGTQSATESTSDLMTGLGKLADFAAAHLEDGSQFITLRVDHNPSQSESFTNSVRESSLAQGINSTVSNSRSMIFNAAGGNIGVSSIDSLVKGTMDAVGGALSSVKLDGLLALAGQAFVTLPKTWDSSTANLPTAEYTMQLKAPSANKIALFTNIYLPIAIMMAASLPLSAGLSSFTSPFICQLYHTGRVQCKTGIITNLSIERGNGNVGWNSNGQMLGATIRFSVADLNELITLPIKRPNEGRLDSVGGIASTFVEGASEMATGNTAAGNIVSGRAFDEESLLQDYAAVLGGLPLSDSFYKLRRLNVNLTQLNAGFRSWRSSTNFMSWILDGGTARLLSNFANTTSRF